MLDLILGLTGSKRLREMAPERIQAAARHLENATHVGRLLLVEKQVCLRSVGVTVASTLQEPKRHESIEEIARRARVQAQAPADGLEGLRTVR